ncbi:riboflavin kinase [Patescibacteria group bacterium]|nr:riboflavin kinase [Patescibacteria group bacterium]
MKGSVIKGNGVGTKLGFPTLNIAYNGDESGVFVAKVNGKYPAVAHVGERPTIGDKKQTLEVHLLNFEGEDFPQTIEVELLERIRGTVHFGSLEELKAQIALDVQFAKNWYT